MSDWDWTDISKPQRFEEGSIKPKYVVKTEKGYVGTRERGTGEKRRFVMGWSALTYTEKSWLITFHDTHTGDGFTFDHPDPSDGGTYTVIIMNENIDFKWNSKLQKWFAEVEMREP